MWVHVLIIAACVSIWALLWWLFFSDWDTFVESWNAPSIDDDDLDRLVRDPLDPEDESEGWRFRWWALTSIATLAGAYFLAYHKHWLP